MKGTLISGDLSLTTLNIHDDDPMVTFDHVKLRNRRLAEDWPEEGFIKLN